MNDLAALAKLVAALRPWLLQLVIVGGWAHRLHRFHALAGKPGYMPIRTKDADLALPLDAKIEGDIRAALTTAGFQEELSGDVKPPVTHYVLAEDAGFYAEFLVPLAGSGYKRDGGKDATIAKAGVTAQKLRYLEVLLDVPWAVRLTQGIGVPLETPADVTIANPISFIAQKLLIHKSRRPAKQAQDVLYIHDTLELFGGSLQSLRELWVNDVRPKMHKKAALKVEAATVEIFGNVTDVIREAARIPQDRTLLPERLQAVCTIALSEILGN